MGRVKFRKVKEIYATSVEVDQPKNTESEGNDGAGGHADAAEQAVESNEGLSVIGEQQNPSEEIRSRQKSGACDVCTSSCSCMLSERHASAAEGTKAHEASMVDNSPHGSPVKAIKELSHEVAVLSKRSDTAVVSSLKDPYIGASSSKGLWSKFSDEQVESSLDGEVRNVQNWADSVKAEFEINGEVAAECSYQKEHLQKLDGDGETIMQPANRCDGVENVKTCGICGDVGWDDCLATCSRCSNGAEHIYCMRLKLDKVPEGNWLCEDCTLADENEKKRQDESSKNCVEGSSSYQQREDSGTSDSVKRTMDSSKTLPIKKRRALKKVDELSILSKPCFKAAEDCSLASWNLDEKKTDSTSQGSLCKSKSFNNIKSGVESNQQGGGAEKQCVDKETVICDDEKEGPAHSESSIKNSMSGDGKVVDSQVNKPCSEFPQAKNLNRTSLAKILSMAAHNNWQRNLVRPPVLENGASTSQRSGQTPVQGETVFAVPPGSKHHDIMDVQGDGKSSEPSKSNSETVFSVPPRSKHHDIMDVQGDGKSSEPSKSNSETIFPVPPRSKHHDIMAVQGDGKSSQSSKSNSAMKFVEKMTTALVTKPNNLIAPSSSGVPPRPESMPGITSAVNNSSCFPISPQFNCIWQGGFEVLGKGAIQKPCDGIQAHLSTCSVPKVCEVAQRLPQKILVVQVPLKAVRPSQFEQSLAIEDNIALYFFARDVESYETNYKNLLDQMIMCDLALKGNIDGVELLIFTSNLLPEKLQRWNGLLFLWGVFRAMKSSNSQDLPSPLSISSVSGVYADPSGSLPSPQSSGMLSTSNTLYNITPKAPDSYISSEKPCLTSAELGKTSDNEISSPQSKLSGLQNADEQLSAVGSLSKTVQPSGDLHPRDILPRETKGGKSSEPSKSNSETVFSVPPRSKHHDIMDVQGDGKSSEPSKSNSETIFPVPPRSKHHDIMAVQGDGKSSQSSKSNSAMKFVEKMTTALVTKPNNLIAPSSSSGVPPRPESMPGITSAVNNSSCFPISPQFNCIWQGGFEVLGKGAIPKPCDGIQAHLSTCSAPKVCEVAQRLPQKILVVQVPLKAVRPSQFEQSLAIEDNIALYFFARDVKSYETNYKNLLDQMIMCDLALKGNVDGVELLIFTSNLLPEKLQRWNGLLFLWGVFRAMKSSNSQDLPSPLSISSVSGVYADPSGSLPSPQSSGMLSTSNTLYNITPKAPDSCISSEKPCLTSAELGKTSDNEISSPQSKLSGLQNADEQLSAVGSLSKTVQPSGDLHPRDILPGETKGGKRRAEIEIDLLASRETNDKRWKSYLEMFQHNRRPRFSSEFKRLDSGSGKDQRLGRALTTGPVFPPPQAVSMKDKNVLEPEILNLELSLGTGKKKVAQEISSPSLGLVDNNKGKCSIDRTSNGNDECLTSLTLSLALPVSDEQNKDECSISRTSNESDECLTSLTLSLTLPASNEQNKGWNNKKPLKKGTI